MLVLMLVSAMAVGMSWMVMTDQRLGGNNGGREAAFYGAEAGMEKLTADVGNTVRDQGLGQQLRPGHGYVEPILIDRSDLFQNTLGSTYQIICGASRRAAHPAATNATILHPARMPECRG